MKTKTVLEILKIKSPEEYLVLQEKIQKEINLLKTVVRRMKNKFTRSYPKPPYELRPMVKEDIQKGQVVWRQDKLIGVDKYHWIWGLIECVLNINSDDKAFYVTGCRYGIRDFFVKK